MAWVSPKVYAILKNSEEGKDILEGIADKSQEEVDKEVDAFFGKGGKGFKSNAEYSQAKMDDEAEERAYQEMGDEEVGKGGSDLEEGKPEKHDGYETDDTPSATRYKKKDEFNNDIIILKMKDSGKYKVFRNGGFIGKSAAHGDDFNSFEEAENALSEELGKDNFEKGEEVEINEGYGSPTKAKILRRMPQKELDDLYYSLNPHAPGGYYEVEYDGLGGNKQKKVVWTRRIDRKK